MSIWREGQEFVQSVQTGNGDFLRLKSSQYVYVKDKSKCLVEENDSFYKCAGNIMVKLLNENPSQYCLQINSKMVVDRVSNESYPICGSPNTQNMAVCFLFLENLNRILKSIPHFQSVINIAFDLIMKNCKSSCTTTEYSGKKSTLRPQGTDHVRITFE